MYLGYTGEIVLSKIKVDFGDGEVREYEAGITAGDVVRDVHGRKSGFVAALIDGMEKDMSTILESDCKIEPIDGESDAGMYILRHSCAHLLAQAVTQLYPDAKPTIGPPIEHGFYYDFFMQPVGDEELKKIENKMKDIMTVSYTHLTLPTKA